MFEGNVLPLRIYIRAILNKRDTIRERDYKIYIYIYYGESFSFISYMHMEF